MSKMKTRQQRLFRTAFEDQRPLPAGFYLYVSLRWDREEGVLL